MKASTGSKIMCLSLILIIVCFPACRDSDLIASIVNSQTARIEIRNETKDTSINAFVSIKSQLEIEELKNILRNSKKTDRNYNTKGNYGALEISLIDINNGRMTVRNIKTDQGYAIKNGNVSYDGHSIYEHIKNRY